MNKTIEDYLGKVKGFPLLCAVGDSLYKSFLDELHQFGCKELRLSDYCMSSDKFPDFDRLIDDIRTGDIDYRSNKYVVLGIGEYLALKGKDEADKTLARLKDLTLGNARVIVLLRGITAQVMQLFERDPRIEAQGRGLILDAPQCNLSITNNVFLACKGRGEGFKGLLRQLENGKTGKVTASTILLLDKSTIPVKIISSSYDAVCFVSNNAIPKELGNEALWDQMADELHKHSNLSKMFERNSFSLDTLYEDFYSNLNGLEFKNWLYYVFLYVNRTNVSNSYLQYLLAKNLEFGQFKKAVISEITSIAPESSNYQIYYKDRKRLLKEYRDADLADFIAELESVSDNAIYYYTDNTKQERYAIIIWLARHEINPILENIYPALWQYLSRYEFVDLPIAKELTEYFDLYKQQKVKNKIHPDFLSLVENYANIKLYASLNTRDNEINAIPEKESTMLYWVDALGVEYLSYIVSAAKKYGLAVHIDIGRADLPTVTDINKRFYLNWPGPYKYKDSRLDDVKHKEAGGFVYTNCTYPIHIEEELNILDNVIGLAAQNLAQHKYKSFVIASDHGASRLAVLANQEEKYETDTKGEHSGRCCKAFPDCDLPYKIEENGYYVLTNYGRFKYSRAANVEVHGGASLEEVIVPMITLELKSDMPTIRLVGEKNIYADRHDGTTIKVYISSQAQNLSYKLRFDGNDYAPKECANNTYTFVLQDVKRARKNCIATIYDGQDLLKEISFDIKSKLGGSNTDFDDLF